MRELKDEIRQFNEAKARMMENEMEGLLNEQKECEDSANTPVVKKLDAEKVKFDRQAEDKVAKDAELLRLERMKTLREEMKAFEAQRREMEDELDVVPSSAKSAKESVSVGKLDVSKTKFDSLEQQRAEKRLQELQEQRMKDLQAEIDRMEEEREIFDEQHEKGRFFISYQHEEFEITDLEEKQEVQKSTPKKLTTDFEKMQLKKQLELEREMKDQKMRQMQEELQELQVRHTINIYV